MTSQLLLLLMMMMMKVMAVLWMLIDLAMLEPVSPAPTVHVDNEIMFTKFSF